MIALVDPSEFQGIALAWIGALSAIVAALFVALGILLPKFISFWGAIQQLKQSTEDNANRLSDHSRRITNNSNRLTEVALVTAPPAIEAGTEALKKILPSKP